TGTALVLTIFALQDSFGTACNVTGDGALSLFLSGYVRKRGIEESDEHVELFDASDETKIGIGYDQREKAAEINAG
ncbi:MAG: dicarboxylate/amino acid:cation symporter, partial [Slackia piriformis]|nr:dicarboxylate/amino acid:cation symporter [Slackia piriformis]